MLAAALEECEWRYNVESLAGRVTLENKGGFVENASRYYLLVQPMAMLQEFLEGLKTYNVNSLIHTFYQMFKTILCMCVNTRF